MLCTKCHAEPAVDQGLCVRCALSNTPAAVPEKWYFRKTSLILIFLMVGPLVLPLIWMHPRLPRSKKIFWTALLGILTYGMVVLTAQSVKSISETYRQLNEVLTSIQ